MVDQWSIFNVEEHMISSNTEAWVFDKHRPGDRDFTRMFFPKAAVAWRAAEYDLDTSTPTALASVWDLLLHEPYMPSTMLTGPVVKGRAAPAQQVHLYNAPTKQAAKDAHFARLATVKQTVAQINWPRFTGLTTAASMLVGGAPVHALLERVLSEVPHPDDIEEKRQIVHGHRQSLGLEVAPALVVPTVPKQYYDPAVRRRGLTVVLKD